MTHWRSRLAMAAVVGSASVFAVGLVLSIASVLDYRGGLRAFELAGVIGFITFVPAAFLWRGVLLRVLTLLPALALLAASSALVIGSELDPLRFAANLPPSDTVRSVFWVSALATFVLTSFALGLALKPSWLALAPVAALASIALPFVPFLVSWTFVILSGWPLVNTWIAGACLWAAEHRRGAAVMAGSNV